MEKLSKAKIKANKKWDEAHKERINYLRSRSRAKTFILNKATLADLETILAYVEERKNFLKNNQK